MEWWNIHKGKLCYRLFKTDFKFENYLITLPKNKWKPLIEFRTGNGYFPGNHFNIPSDNKAIIKCPLCTHFNPDLFHYLLSCSHFNRFRRKFKVKSVVNTLSFRNVMNSEKTLFNVATFVKCTQLARLGSENTGIHLSIHVDFVDGDGYLRRVMQLHPTVFCGL